MIKKFEAFNDDIDPYGEEDWDDDKFIFNEGDTVICINNDGSGRNGDRSPRLKLGQEYFIAKVYSAHGNKILDILDKNGEKYTFYYQTRFKKK